MKPTQALRVRLFLGVLLAGGVGAHAGEVSGTVRGVGGLPLADRLVGLIGPSGGMSTVTDAAGHYSFTDLPAATYFAKLNIVATWPSLTPDPDGLVGELYADIPCPLNGCTEGGTDISVPENGVVTIDFDLRPGSQIQGTVLASGGGGLGGITVNTYDAKGRYVASTSTNGSGAYTIRGIPGGSYYLHTYSAGSRSDRLYPDIPCGNNQCDPTAGLLVGVAGGATLSGVDFTLPVAGKIAGKVVDGNGNPVVDATVEVWSGTNRFGFDFQTDALGDYLVEGLPAGSAFRVLARKAGLVTAVHPATPCPNAGCDIGSTGTAVAVVAGATTGGKNVQLFPGHSISGTLAGGAFVQVFGSTGLAGSQHGGSSYTIGDLPDGTYRVRASRARQITEFWNDRACSGAFLCAADDVVVAGADVSGINFVLGAAGWIQGRIFDAANGDPIAQLGIASTFAGTGTSMSDGVTNRDGLYETNSEGLPPGNFKLRTVGPTNAPDYRDELWDDRPCEPTCNLATGDSVMVSGTAATIGKDFALVRSGVRFFTVTPCRVYDSRQLGGPLGSGVLYPLRLEGICGIPGHATAVSANLTVVGASADGHLVIWPFNLTSTPPTSVSSVRGGTVRANNAILGMSLSGFSNVAIQAQLGPTGSYHLVLDVNGYFAPSVAP